MSQYVLHFPGNKFLVVVCCPHLSLRGGASSAKGQNKGVKQERNVEMQMLMVTRSLSLSLFLSSGLTMCTLIWDVLMNPLCSTLKAIFIFKVEILEK